MARRIAFIFLLCSALPRSHSHAQTLNSYDDYMTAVQRALVVGDFQTAKILCAEAMIKSVFRPEAYIYTAMVMYKTDQFDDAMTYAQKAERMRCTEAQRETIRAIKEAITDKKEFNELMLEGEYNKKVGRLADARSSYLKAWELFPVRTDAAFYTVELMIELKEFSQAMELLQKLVNYPDAETAKMARRLYEALDNSPQIVAKKAFESNLSAGDGHMRAERYNEAIRSYQAALGYRPYEPEVKRKLAAAEEELAYQKATQSSYVEQSESYADRYPNGKYISTINQRLRQSYVSIGKKAYAARNLSQMLDMQRRFKSRFPGESGVDTLEKLIGEYYFETAEAKLTGKDWSGAKEHYQLYLTVQPHGDKSADAWQMIRKCDRRLRQTDISYVMYSYEAETPISISFGGLKKDRIGSYLNLKMNPDVFTLFSSLYNIDNDGNHNRPGVVQRTGDVIEGCAGLSFGLTFKIVYPFYGYTGGGLAYRPVYEHADVYFSSGDFWEEDWLRNTDKTKVTVFPEGGIMLRIADVIILKAGLVYDSQLTTQFGLGIKI